jgi:hypothetical protein
MDTKPRLTKQGIKDLNHYGPKPVRAVAEAPSSTSDEEVKASPPVGEEKPEATVSASV